MVDWTKVENADSYYHEGHYGRAPRVYVDVTKSDSKEFVSLESLVNGEYYEVWYALFCPDPDNKEYGVWYNKINDLDDYCDEDY